MNGSERKDLHTVLDVLKEHKKEREELATDVRDIKVCLMGDTKKHDDLGLQGAVERNTHFRKSTLKVMWLMVAGIVSTAFIAIKSNFR